MIYIYVRKGKKEERRIGGLGEILRIFEEKAQRSGTGAIAAKVLPAIRISSTKAAYKGKS